MAAGLKIPLEAKTNTFSIADRPLEAEYMIFRLREQLKFDLDQSAAFRAQEMTTTLHFPVPVQYTIRDGITGAALSTGTSDSVSMIVGDSVELVAPELDPTTGGSLIPTFELSNNTYLNQTDIHYSRAIVQEAGSFGFEFDGLTIIDIGIYDAKLPDFDFSFGPQLGPNEIYLPATRAGYFESSEALIPPGVTWATWEVRGFGAVTGRAALLDPRPHGTAAFVAPASALANQGVRFEAELTPYAGGPNLFYDWDFGDGSVLDRTNSAAYANRVVQHVYRSSGSYDVTLTVTESRSAGAHLQGETLRSWTSTRAIVVDATPPRVSGVDYDGGAGAVALAVDAELADTQVTGLGVTFDEPMNNPPGDAGAGDVTNPSSYLLVRLPDGTNDPLSCTPIGAACATSDQVQVQDDGAIGLLDGKFGQSFTVGRTGSLTAIAVYLNRFDPGNRTLRVHQGGISGSSFDTYAPSGALVREQAVTLSAGRNLLVLVNPLPVVAGQVYTFTIAGGDVFASYAANNGNTYPGGQALWEAGHDHLFETWVTLPGAQAPFGQLDGGTPINVDGVTYDGATRRAALTLNGGNPLPNGHYRLIVRAGNRLADVAGNVLDGNGDGVIGGDFVRDFSLSSAAPRVVSVGSSAAGNIAEGARTREPLADLTVAFNEPVHDPVGNSDPHDVTNPANYVLLGAGENGEPDAEPCVAVGSLCLRLDQEVTEPASGSTTVGDGFFGQYFHVRNAGDMAGVSIKIDEAEAGAATFALYAGTWPGPTLPPTALRSQSVTLQPAWNTVTFATPLPTNAGDDYFFVITGVGQITAPWVPISVSNFDYRAISGGARSYLYRVLLTPTTSVPGLASLGDDVAIPINGVTYDAVARAATLALNGGTPLPFDDYRLIVRGSNGIIDADGIALDGDGDGTPGGDFTRSFVGYDPDAGPPFVRSVFADGAAGGGALAGTSQRPISSIAVHFNKSLHDGSGDSASSDVTNPANYRVYRGAADGPFASATCADALGLSTVSVDGVAYDDTTHTATLSLNSGAALPDGAYALVLCGGESGHTTALEDTVGQRLDGAGDGIGGTDFRRPFAVSVTPPTVTGVLAVHADQSGSLVDGGSLPATGATALQVALSKAVQDPAGSSLAPDVTNPAGYALFFAGANFVIDSAACGAPAGDDVAVVIDGVTYDGATATVYVNGGVPLPAGTYRLLVCGDGTLADDVAHPLDGNGDGTGGDDFALTFNTGAGTVPARVTGAGWDDGQLPAPGPIVTAVDSLYVTLDRAVLDVFGDDDPHDVTNPAHYQLVRASAAASPATTGCDVPAPGDAAVAIDGVAYDAAALRITLALNGGLPLTSGAYRLIVCATSATDAAIVNLGGFPLDGDGDGIPGGDFISDFVIDNTPPTVTGVTVQGLTGQAAGDPVPDTIQAVSMRVTFSRSMANPAGDTGARDLTNPKHYRLLTPGVDGLFQTTACGPVLGDDVATGASAATAFDQAGLPDSGVVVDLKGLGSAQQRWLLAGSYRFEICPSLHGAAGNALDGSEDGAAGDAFTRAFSVVDETPPTVLNVNTVPANPDNVLASEEEVTEAVTALLIRFSEPLYDPPGDSDPRDVTNPANYRVYRAHYIGDLSSIACSLTTHDGFDMVPIDAVSYDAVTRTAALALNGGRPLRDDTYELLVCGSSGSATQVTDLLGHPLAGYGGEGAADYVYYFITTGDHPTVANVGIVEDVVHGTLVDDKVLPGDVNLTQFLVRFDQEMLNGFADLSNYRLIAAGEDGVIDTAACGPVAGDDVAIALALSGIDYDPARATLALQDLPRLPDDGSYRLIVCPGILDMNGDALDGDPSVAGSEAFTLDFSIPVNPRRVDAELADLTLTPPAEPALGGESATVTAEATVLNHGPFGPADFEVTFEATAPAGCTLDGDASVAVPLIGVAADGAGTVSADFALTCDAPGDYDLEVTASVAPADPNDTPEAIDDNNTLSATITVTYGGADAEVSDATATAPADPTATGEPATLTVEATATNHGPFGPADFVATIEATAADGCTVADEHPKTVELTLDVDESAPLSVTFEITCDDPGDHDVEVVIDLAAASAELPDTDLSNNTTSATATVSFVLAADGRVVSVDGALDGPALPVGGAGEITVTTTVVNGGPSDADFELTSSAALPDGCAVLSGGEAQTVTLVVNEPRTVDTTFTVACAAALEGTFAFASAIVPADLVVDDNGDNDEASGSLTARAVSPYAIIDVGPRLIAEGSGDATLTVTGDVLAGFVADADELAVHWNGTPLDTTVVDDSHLQAILPASALTDAGGDYRAGILTLTRSTGGSVVATSNPLRAYVVVPELEALRDRALAAGATATVAQLPSGPVGSGISAEVTHASGADATAIVASYLANPVHSVEFGNGGGFVDLRIENADTSDSVVARLYYPSTVDAASEDRLELWYFDGAGWQPVLGSGGVAPGRDTTDDLDGTTSGGRFAVTLDATSTPAITTLAGTVFAMTVPDATPPVTTATTTGTAGDGGWFKAGDPVVVTLDATDPGTGPGASGVASTTVSIDGGPEVEYAGPITLTDGVHTLAFFSTDEAGNVEDAQSVTVRVDQTPPAIDGARAPAANADGWNAGDVTVTFACADDPPLDGIEASGLAACEGGATLTAEGTGQSVTGTATDVAGNSAEATVSGIAIDHTAPETTAAAAGEAGEGGWYVGPVTVTLTAADALSGVAGTSVAIDEGGWLPYTAPVIVEVDGAHVVRFRSTDVAGNEEAEQSIDVRVDQTPPTIGGAVTPAANAHGWHNGDVGVAFTCTDHGAGASGVASCDGDAVLTDEGAGQAVTGTAADAAGNTATVTVDGIAIDRTPPTVTAVPSGEPNEAGWYAGPVTVAAEATDAPSGVDAASCTTVTVADEGVDQAATVTCADLAGNTASATLEGIAIDLTPPETAATVEGPAGDDGWSTGATTVSLAAADALSGVAAIAVSVNGGPWQPYAGALTLADDGRHTVRFRATDVAGNEEAERELAVAIDATAPVTTGAVSGTEGNGGWFIAGAPVQLTLDATDATSGVAETWYRVGGGAAAPYGGPVSLPGGEYTVAFWSVDRAGNTAAEQQLSVRVDMTPPAVTVTGVEPGGTYLLGEVTPGCEATDPGAAGSGLAGPCTGTLQAPGTATGAGTYTYTATASDLAGNTTTVSIAYQVVYDFGGFESPLRKRDSFTLGQAIPVKFRLRNAIGKKVRGAVATVTVNGAPAPLRGHGDDDGDDDGGGKYVYVVDTSPLSAGPAAVTVTLDDGQSYGVTIDLVAKERDRDDDGEDDDRDDKDKPDKHKDDKDKDDKDKDDEDGRDRDNDREDDEDEDDDD